MIILSFETSCDETAISVIESTGDIQNSTHRVLGNIVYSQAAKHAEFGGVYPNLAKREHQENLVPLTTEALKQASLFSEESTPVPDAALSDLRDESFKESVRAFLASIAKPAIDEIVVTQGPGLEPALWTGINFAETLGKAWGVPVRGVDHMEGHIVSALVSQDAPETYVLSPVSFPILALLISGGHTELILMRDWFSYELIGKTRDDAVGEAFDKVARLLDLPYPGGPEVAKYAASQRNETDTIRFPRPMIGDQSCDFSFSGLKTAVLYHLKEVNLTEEEKGKVARAFEDAARDVLVKKTEQALTKTDAQTLVVGGGVSANTHIREGVTDLVEKNFPHVSLKYPHNSLTGDNALMIGIAGFLRAQHKDPIQEKIVAAGNQSLA